MDDGWTADKITVYQYKITTAPVQVFPNPVKDTLTITGLENFSNLKDIQISTVIGQPISAQVNGDYTIDVSTFANGIHFIHLIFEHKTYSLKFTKNWERILLKPVFSIVQVTPVEKNAR